MGFFKSLFGGKKIESPDTTSIQTPKRDNTARPEQQTSISVQDLALMSLARTYKINEQKYPDYLRSKYGIGFPKEKLLSLSQRGFIRPTSAVESLPRLKGTELKAIASQFGLKTSGKKEDLCTRIAEGIPSGELEKCFSDRYWILTEAGRKLLDENPYIEFYLEDHLYSLEASGLDFYSYTKLFISGKKTGSIRDILWGEFNRKSVEYYRKGMSKGQFFEYCGLLRTMALFLEEENRHLDSLSLYMKYLHYRSNFEAAVPAMQFYSLSKKTDSAADILFVHAEILPFIAQEVQLICNGCGFDSKHLKEFMINSFSKERDTGLFSPADLAQFVMAGMNGDRDTQEKICRSAMRVAAKNSPKRR